MTDYTNRLGRKPSPPDPRNWKLSSFLATDNVAAAIAELQQTTVGYKNNHWVVPPAGTHWAKGLALLNWTPPPPTPSGDKIWTNPRAVLDQGDYGTCVGNGWAQWGNTNPVNDSYVEKDARAIYYEATVIDGQPDDPDKPGGGQNGSYVPSGAKAMKDRGRLAAYAFADTTDEITQWVTTKGPLVVGTDWTEDMFNPSVSGLVKPTGQVAGGHCYLLLGYHKSVNQYEFLNSWGQNWGASGHFFMTVPNFATLLGQQGEALASIELAL